jgi:hypothetical protein
MSHRGIELIAIELAFPATDDHGGDAITDQICQRTQQRRLRERQKLRFKSAPTSISLPIQSSPTCVE